jgi:hypothetical protein
MEYWSTRLAESLLLLDWRSPVREFCVKELMVPLSEYATVPEGSTLFDAVLALEKAQEEFDHTIIDIKKPLTIPPATWSGV